MVAPTVISSSLYLFLFIRKSKQSLRLVDVSSDSVWAHLKPLTTLFHSWMHDETRQKFCLENMKPCKDVSLSWNTVAVSDTSRRMRDIMSCLMRCQLSSVQAHTLPMSHSYQSS